MGALDGKVAIVTGSGQGIGRGIAIGLAREGAKVVVNNRKPGTVSVAAYDKDSMPAEDYEEAKALSGDAESTAEAALDSWGRVDIIVNNAGGTGTGSIATLDEAMWDKLTITKMKGAFNMMHAALPSMMEQKFGRIFNCSSDAWIGLPDNDAYSAGNAGVVGLTWAAAKELFRFGITVNAYCPQGASPAHAVEYHAMLRNIKQITGQDPDPRLLATVEADHGDSTNLGPIFAFLSTEEAGYISGEVFGLKSSGKIDRYPYPQPIAHAERERGTGALWDVGELADVFRETVMGEDYVSHASKSVWSK